MDFQNYEEELIGSFNSIAKALQNLGTGNAASGMGAIEFLATEIRKGAADIAGSLSEIGEAIRDRP